MVRRFEQQRAFAAWYGGDRRMLVTLGTRRALFSVSAPGATPERLSAVPTGARYLQWSRDTVRRYLVYALDQGGSERYRFYRYDLDSATTTLLTPQAAGAYAGGLDPGGTPLAFMSNERNGVDSDIYIVDVRQPDPRIVGIVRSLQICRQWPGPGQPSAPHLLVCCEHRQATHAEHKDP